MMRSLSASNIALACAASLVSSPVLATMSVHTDGLAGAGSLSVRALDASSGNPAVLAWDSSLMVRAVGSVEIQNDTYRWDDYRRWNGARWSDEDKEAILSRVEEDGIDARLAYGAQLPAVAFRSWALTTTSRRAVRAFVPREYAELVLRGNQVGEQVNLTSSTAEEMELTDIALSHGRTVLIRDRFSISGGANLHYLRAGDLRELVSIRGSLHTTEEVLDGEVIVESRTAEGGAGFAIDFGLAAKIGDRLAPRAEQSRASDREPSAAATGIASSPAATGSASSVVAGTTPTFEIGFVITSLVSSVRWDRDPRSHIDTASADSLTLNDVDGSDDLVEVQAHATKVPAFERSLARELGLSAGYTRRDVRFDGDIRVGLDDDPFVSTEPRLAIGASFLRWVSDAASRRKTVGVVPRCGVALGGIDGPVLAFGLGARVERFHFDLAYRNLGNFHLLLPKGIGIGLSVSYAPETEVRPSGQ